MCVCRVCARRVPFLRKERPGWASPPYVELTRVPERVIDTTRILIGSTGYYFFFSSAQHSHSHKKLKKRKAHKKLDYSATLIRRKEKNSRLHRTSSWGCYVSSLKPQASAKSVTVQKLPAHRTYPSRTGLSVTKTRHLQLIGRSRAPLRHSL